MTVVEVIESRGLARRTTSVRAPERGVFGIAAILFGVSAAMTIRWCASMPAMGETQMPGGWTISMVWMRVPGETWPGAAASFGGMWTVMMAAMMLPSLFPALVRYRKAIDRAGHARPARLTALVGVGYFLVWALYGLAIFVLGAALAAIGMHLPTLARAAPTAAGVVVLIAGAIQFSAWKARHLARCRGPEERVHMLVADYGTAFRSGVRLGLHCGYSSAGLTAILLVIGVMDLRAMTVVSAAITLERLAPAGARVARVIGVISIGAGLLLIVRAAGVA